MFDYLLIEEAKRRKVDETDLLEPSLEYESPSNSFERLVRRFGDMRKQVFDQPTVKNFCEMEIFKSLDNVFNVNLILATLLVVSILGNGFLYTQYQDYREVSVSYVELYNVTKVVQSYYDTLMNRYSELRTEYAQLNDLYIQISDSKREIELEYQELLSFQKEILLVSEKTITIPPKQNVSETLETPFSGFITVNYTSTGDAYTWTGSTKLNSYYSRNPPFPETASVYNYTVPVVPDVILYFANPSETESITLTYSVNYTY